MFGTKKGESEMKTILIIEDDAHISDMVSDALTAEGFRVLQAWSGTEALLLLEKETPDLILLDLMLPGYSGEELLPQIKEIPVIVISAKAGVDSKVETLLSGARDYLSKPFSLKELLARITVQLRNTVSRPRRTRLSFERLSLDTASHEVFAGDVPVKLTRTEFAILKLLMGNPSQVFTKAAILDALSEETPDCMESSLKVHVSNLRKKLRAACGRDYIESVWGIGFKLSGEHESEEHAHE